MNKDLVKHEIKSLYYFIENGNIFGQSAIDCKRILDNDGDNDITDEEKLKLAKSYLKIEEMNLSFVK